MSEAKFMRIIVFFDLPVTTAAKRKAANQFRQFLLKNGYQMLQLSVYSRIETFAKKPFPRQQKPKHRFSAVFAPNYS